MVQQHTPYRLAIDVGSSSLGWALLRVNKNADQKWEPTAIIRAGVRIFPDGRNPKDGTSLAVTRREARGARRRRDRMLRRRARMLKLLEQYGFFPKDELERKKLELINPYQVRSDGLSKPLTPAELGRAIFHLNQRRGFKSNRKTDAKDSEAGLMSSAIQKTKEELKERGCETVGEYLYQRMGNNQTVRARYRETPIPQGNGRNKIEKSYDLYINRQLVEEEFDLLWERQSKHLPQHCSEAARQAIKDCLLFQRPLRPVDPGRCSLLPDEKRAALALPSVQRFRIYQEVNNLRLIDAELGEQELATEARQRIIQALEENNKRTFKQLRSLLKTTAIFNLEDEKRTELNGNKTGVTLSKLFGAAVWHDLSLTQQDAIVTHLLEDESEAGLTQWLQTQTGVNAEQAQAIANMSLTPGYGRLSTKAVDLILPELAKGMTYDQAVQAAGFDHHSQLSHADTGEILPELPYYGKYLQRHVGFGSGKPEDSPEKRWGRIANPTVHIGLNQIRTVVNAIIARYGHPTEVIVEVARELKQSTKQRLDEQRRQAANQKRNERMRQVIAKALKIAEHQVKRDDIQKMILWEELNPHDAADRRCPYSGVQISLSMLLSDEVEIEHILPYSRTLDDSLNNKTVSMWRANRIKKNRTPWEAKEAFEAEGWDFASMVHRVMFMNHNKRYRFGEGAYQNWLRNDKDFLARALNDTAYLSKISREYLSLICPKNHVRVIPGSMTGKLRYHLGLNGILGLEGEKNRDDHRHHAVDACVIGITDQGMLQRFANASKTAEEKELQRLVEHMEAPWETYRDHVKRAIESIKVSHKPDHGYQGSMHNDTAYGLLSDGMVYNHKLIENERTKVEEKLTVIPMTQKDTLALKKGKLVPRHGLLPDGTPRAYKGYKGDSNYCMEIIANEKGRWEGRVISTFEVYQFVRQWGENKALQKLQNAKQSIRDDSPIIMRLMRNDCVRFEHDGKMQCMRLVKLASSGQITFAPLHEANVDARDRNKDDPFKYTYKTAGSLQKSKGRQITISPIGEVTDRGFKG